MAYCWVTIRAVLEFFSHLPLRGNLEFYRLLFARVCSTKTHSSSFRQRSVLHSEKENEHQSTVTEGCQAEASWGCKTVKPFSLPIWDVDYDCWQESYVFKWMCLKFHIFQVREKDLARARSSQLCKQHKHLQKASFLKKIQAWAGFEPMTTSSF